MDPDSPFAHLDSSKPIEKSTQVCVNFCFLCHHVWKAPAETKKCINCQKEETVACLAKYVIEVPRI